MSPIFIIYLAASISLFFAILDCAAYSGHAYLAYHAIEVLKPEGGDLTKMQEVQNQDLDSAAEWFVLALLQTTILLSTRKFQKHALTLNHSPEPSAVGPDSSATPPTPKVGGG
jgi:hypothetical protein